MAVTPYQDSTQGKKQQVEQMFDAIAFRYDLLNRLLSLGIDKVWRKKAINRLSGLNPAQILDVATGTGDVALALAKRYKHARVTGLDLSRRMLDLAVEKAAKSEQSAQLEFIKGDSEQLPFGENNFDAVTVAFGVRNFENLDKGLAEIYRVIRPGGMLVVLEFSMPEKFPVKQLYSIYFKKLLPFAGAVISGDRRAYTYLPESVAAFPSGTGFTSHMQKQGFKNLQAIPLMAGIASIYTGAK